MLNPDPKKYAMHKRSGGRMVLVDRQILAWRKKRRAEAKAKEAQEAASMPQKAFNPFA